MKVIVEGQGIDIRSLGFWLWRETSSLLAPLFCLYKLQTKTKTMGRRQGSKNNSKHHEAGGKRKGAGRPKTKKDAPAQQRLQQATLRNAFRGPTDAAEEELHARAAIAEQQPTNAAEEELHTRAAIAEQQRKEAEEAAKKAGEAAATKQKEEAAAQRREEQRQRMLKKL
jgi:hypothetical protein